MTVVDSVVKGEKREYWVITLTRKNKPQKKLQVSASRSIYTKIGQIETAIQFSKNSKKSRKTINLSWMNNKRVTF